MARLNEAPLPTESVDARTFLSINPADHLPNMQQ